MEKVKKSHPTNLIFKAGGCLYVCLPVPWSCQQGQVLLAEGTGQTAGENIVCNGKAFLVERTIQPISVRGQTWILLVGQGFPGG